MVDNSFFESLAHYASGMATVSFATWAVILYKLRKRNRMTFLLFLSVAYIAISFLNDMVFLVPSQAFGNFKFVENLVSLFDLSVVPIASAFFVEATRPGTITDRRLLAIYLPFVAFIPLYCLLQATWVLDGSFLLSMIVAVCTLVAVPVNAIRYNKYITDNYSYTKNIGVGWCTSCTLVLFLLVIFYEVCFYEPTWFSEMTYDASFLIIWNIVCMKTRHHHVVADMMAFDNGTNGKEGDAPPAPQPAIAAAKKLAEEPGSQPSDGEKPSVATDSEQARGSFIATSLLNCMETDKMFLNSRLSLSDLATAVGTNKTYISTYINGQGITFYDFINKYRIEEACRIIDQRAAGERLSMADVAARSGFNSVSSFNRYFSKIKGITPTAYSRLT